MIPLSEAPIDVLEAGLDGEYNGERRIDVTERDGSIVVSWLKTEFNPSTIQQGGDGTDGTTHVETEGTEKAFRQEIKHREEN